MRQGVVLFWFLRFGGKGVDKNWMAESRDQKLLFVRLMVGDTPRLATGERRGWEYVGTWRRALVVSDLQPRAGAKTRYLEPNR